jgi:hypothetical protein
MLVAMAPIAANTRGGGLRCGAGNGRGTEGEMKKGETDLMGSPFFIAFFADALAASAITRHALLRHPDVLWQRAGLPEDIDGNAAARVPVAADA